MSSRLLYAANMILLVEDCDDDARFLQRVFRKAGVTNAFITMESGDEAIRYLKGEAEYADRNRFPMPNVVFLDIQLPGKSGFEVLAWIRQQPSIKDLLVLVVSGQGELTQVAEAYKLGANSFLTKPVNRQHVLNLIDGFPGYWTFDQLQPCDSAGTTETFSIQNASTQG